MRSLLPVLVLSVLLTLLLPGAGRAQRSGLGLKAGFVLSETKSSKITTNLIPNASAGAYFALRAGNRLELQPEVLLTSLGSGYTLPEGDRSTVRMLYVQMPLSAKVYLGTTLNLQGGFQANRLLLAQQSDPSGSSKVTESYNTWDFGLALGLGADLVSGFDLGFRYYNGLRPVLTSDQIYYPRNRSYMLSAGYRIARLKAMHFTRRRG